LTKGILTKLHLLTIAKMMQSKGLDGVTLKMEKAICVAQT